MLTDYFFWFAQPSTVLSNYDFVLGYIFAGFVALSLILWLVKKFFIQHPVTQRLVARTANAMFWMGVVGLIWFSFRYQAIPILSKRFLAALVILIWLVWIGNIKLYFWRRYFPEKQEYDNLQLKNKYINPKKK